METLGFILVIILIAALAGSHLYQSKNVRKPGKGKSETGNDPQGNPYEKTQQ